MPLRSCKVLGLLLQALEPGLSPASRGPQTLFPANLAGRVRRQYLFRLKSLYLRGRSIETWITLSVLTSKLRMDRARANRAVGNKIVMVAYV
jgi:hypothetical protein